MSGTATLTFDIDSTQAQRAISVLDALKASSISVTQQAQQQSQATTNLGQAYSQARDQLSQLVDQTRTYDATLGGLVNRLNTLRGSMRDSQTALTEYSATLTRATAAATAMNATVEGLDRYVSKARELRVSANDLATGLNAITAALQNQTVQGHQTRIMLEQLGVSLQGVGPNQPDVILQRITDTLRRSRSTQTLTQAVQGILGPSFDAQAQLALQAQPYIPYRQQEASEVQRRTQAQIDQSNAVLQRARADQDRREAELRDRESRFTQSPSIWGRLGLNIGSGLQRSLFQTGEQEQTELERISRLPPDQQRAYTRVGAQIGDFFSASRGGWGGRTWQQLTSGTYSQNQADIAQRFREERFQQGFFPAAGNYLSREFQNLPGIQSYQPRTQDQRPLSTLDQLQLRQQQGGILAGVGDVSLQNEVQARLSLQNFQRPDIQQAYTTAFGQDEGARRFLNQGANLRTAARYAAAPEQQFLDESRRQQLVAGVPLDQQARARFQVQFAGQIAGQGAVSQAIAGGTTPQGLVNTLLSPQQRATGEQAFAGQVGAQLTTQSQQTQRQIDFQRDLSTALKESRAAAEDFTRGWQAYIQALDQGASPEQAEQQRQEAIRLALTQRVTQGRALLEQIRQETDVLNQRVEQARRLSTAPPIERAAAGYALGIRTDAQNLVQSGQLTAGQVPEYIQRRQQQTAQTGLAQGQQVTASTSDQLKDQQSITELMQRQGVSLQRATEIYAQQKEFNDAIAKAAAGRDEAAQRELEAQRQVSEEFRRQAEVTKNIQQNLEDARQAAQQTRFEGVLQGLPAYMIPFARQTLGRLGNAAEAGATGSAAAVNNLTGLKVVGGASFRRFDTPEASIAASVQQFQLNQSRGLTTLSQLVHRWADPDPRAEKEVEFISRKTGISANDPVDTNDPAVMQKIMAALAETESGAPATQQVISRGVSMGFGRPVAVAPLTPAAAAAQPPATLSGEPPVTPGAPAVQQAVAPGAAPQLPADFPTPAQQQVIARALQDLASGRPIDLAGLGLPPEQTRAVEQAIMQTWQQNRAGQTTELQVATQQTVARLTQLRQRRALAGQPGRQALVPTLDPNLPPDIARQRAGLQQQETREQLAGQGTEAIAGGTQQLQDTQRQIDALSGSLVGYRDREREVTAALQAEREQRQFLLSDADTEVRKRQLIAQSVDQERLALDEQNKRLQEQNELSQAMLSRGAFADQSDLRRTQMETELAQRFRDQPSLAGTPEGQQLVQQTRQAENLADLSERMGQLREAAHSAQGSIEGALEAIIIRHEPAKQALQGMADQLSSIALKTFVFQPFEKLTSGLLSGVFGGNDNAAQGGQAGAGGPAAAARSGGGGILDFVGRLFGGGGGGGGGASGGAANDNGGVMGLLQQAVQQYGGAIPVVIVGTGGAGGGGAMPLLGGGGTSDGSGSPLGGLANKALGAGKSLMSLVDHGGSSSGANSNSPTNLLSNLPGGGSGSSDSSSGGGLLSNLNDSLAKQYGLLGKGIDSLFGQGFFKGGGLIGSLFGGGSGAGSAAASAAGAASATGDIGDIGDLSGIYAKGGVFSGSVLGDYENQVVSAPTIFRFANGARFGQMGENGPEAIIPLKRGTDGKLGISSSGAGGPHVVFNVNTPDAESFKRSQSQLHSRAASQLNLSAVRNVTN